MIHGLVDRPLSLSVDDIRRFPQVTRVHFVECSGNGRPVWVSPAPDMTPQRTDGLTSNSEWTGVPVGDAVPRSRCTGAATWFLAEGADACMMTRSVPMDKAFDDALVVWAQNGEPLRPEQGFPLRLLLPGWEGNANVKWLRRLELGTQALDDALGDVEVHGPTQGRHGADLQLRDGRQVDHHDALGAVAKLSGHGWRSVSGIAWSGRGRITRVEVSADGGATWHDAELQGDRASEGAHALRDDVELGRQPGRAAQSSDGRNRDTCSRRARR